MISEMLGGRGRSSSPVLVVQKFKVDDSAPDGLFIEIEGRASGLTAWILTRMGLSPKTTLRVTSTEWHKEEASLSGQSHEVIPLTQVATTRGGFSKPLRILVFGLVVGGGTLLWELPTLFSRYGDKQAAMIVILIGLIVCGVCCVLYWLRKRLTISVRTTGGEPSEIRFQRSVIENVPIDLEKTLETVGLLHRKVIEAQSTAATV